PSTTGTHVVQAGETLYRIALRYNTTVETLATLNNIINPNQITAGTILQVPTTGGTNPPQGGPTTPTGGQLTHVVQRGENAFRIGLRYNITVERLALANALFNPNLIYAGQVLIIPR
ncbi:MAG TPA: LysM peptidoglycan-binding domain-containing protein, partial [Aggregatilineales bacterium]|nr:LysM peptidoglycan-binding domain-containing protein [Aggregatilineales bacterium]